MYAMFSLKFIAMVILMEIQDYSIVVDCEYADAMRQQFASFC